MQALCDLAKKNLPCIIFFDEIDGLTRQRESEESSFDRRTKDQLLESFNVFVQEPSIFIIGASKRPCDIDPALVSRFQSKIYFGE